jgi:NAD(P)-dependent dehydrogenase (short-subunit alcohol dehydrogenase family)
MNTDEPAQQNTPESKVLAGKVAFLAGASSGVNLGVALGFAEAGAKVVLISRSQERIEAAAQGLRDAGHQAIGMAADVRMPDAVEAALAATKEKWGNIDIVLSGAAGNFMAPASTLSPNGFKTVVDIDLLGTFNVFRLSYPYLTKPGASLIAITAMQAVKPMAYQIHACAAKAGVNMVTKCLALEWGSEGIRVNAIAPGGVTDTEGMRRLGTGMDLAAAGRAVPLGRWAEKRDIADLAIFLCSQQASYITGTIIDCDGGSALRGDFHA